MYVGIWFLTIILSIIIASRFIQKDKIIYGTIIDTFILINILLFWYQNINGTLIKLFLKNSIILIIFTIPIILIMINRKKQEIDKNKNDVTEYIQKGGNIHQYVEMKKSRK
jgi:hypothetical protein